jgi:hypothetical protein
VTQLLKIVYVLKDHERVDYNYYDRCQKVQNTENDTAKRHSTARVLPGIPLNFASLHYAGDNRRNAAQGAKANKT